MYKRWTTLYNTQIERLPPVVLVLTIKYYYHNKCIAVNSFTTAAWLKWTQQVNGLSRTQSRSRTCVMQGYRKSCWVENALRKQQIVRRSSWLYRMTNKSMTWFFDYFSVETQKIVKHKKHTPYNIRGCLKQVTACNEPGDASNAEKTQKIKIIDM